MYIPIQEYFTDPIGLHPPPSRSDAQHVPRRRIVWIVAKDDEACVKIK
jgi:hypothetical protein